MAKLEGINYSRRAGVPRTMGPQAAVQSYQNKQRVLNAAFDLGESFAKLATESEQIEANADHRADVMSYEQFVAENPTATKEQLTQFASEVLGDATVFDSLDTSFFDARNEEQLPSFLWRTAGMAAVLRKSTEVNSEKIQSPIARRNWESAVSESNDRVLAGAQARSGQDAQRFKLDYVSRETRAAIENRDIERAEELLKSPVWSADPMTKKLLQQENLVAGKMRGVEMALIQAEDTDDYDDILNEVTSPEWGEGIGSDDVLRVASSVITRRNQAQAKEKADQEYTQDLIAMDTLILLSTGQGTMTDVNARASLLGQRHHASLVSAARTIASQGITTDPGVMRGLTMEILSMRSGISIDPEDDRGFDERLQGVRYAILSEIGAGRLSTDDGTRLIKDAESAYEFPYKTEEYTSLVGELRNRILGAGDEGIMSFMATDESRADFANAVDNLRQFIEDNGGSSADLSAWQKDRMPAYLNEAARRAMFSIPDSVKSAVYGDGGLIDNDQTIAKYDADLTEMYRSVRAGDGKYTQAQVDAKIAEYDAYNNWYTDIGQHYESSN